MTEDTFPVWALQEALQRSGLQGPLCNLSAATNLAVRALAAMIVKHEQPPVDRPTLVAREVMALWFETRKETGEVVEGNYNAQQVRSGEYDNRHDFRRARQYLVGVLTGYTDV